MSDKDFIEDIVSKKGDDYLKDIKEEVGTTKYIIKAQINASGIVERPDVVGAIFGQTEGLLSDDLDLRELQKTGRIGRIRVNINSKNGKSTGEIIVPSSLDKVETAILAASLETIDRVGPCNARIDVTTIEDVRKSKRNYVVDRAKIILTTMVDEITPESSELTDEVKESVRMGEIQSFGEDQLPAGPNVDESDAIIVVEGRADVLNLLKYGIKNTLAVEGTSVSKTIAAISHEKTVTAFVDGDRGGELILKELFQVAEVDYIARAPMGKEVEDLTKKEIIKALRNKIPAEQWIVENIDKPRYEQSKPQVKHDEKEPQQKHHRPESYHKPPEPIPLKKPYSDLDRFGEIIEKLPGTLDAYLLDAEGKIKHKVSVRDLVDAMRYTEDYEAVVFDGVVTQRLVDIAGEKGVKFLVGVKTGNITKKPVNLKVLSFKEQSGEMEAAGV
ncbi:MAG: DNA primase DnaG [Candidatus Methanofastidiosum methylothiophilum]|jgi:DNA primase|uniref:DNA primase DnaG n=1 Tax=Candidatus Methanofastidiosum methylothiophilum TaxID=1705564 RepID=A0A150JJ03_9EURY|nr:MAG: DNA primase DnaG [Candidatus Methanofastidiosum methylthiophilus]OQC51754.1 MAG: DNA primase DnaG [Euryarchaeota archaeon ADurb.Bin023]HNV93944.1 DNA primase DnaG [Methanofastidiosum sp.]KYC56181.1 MAG: DNA primase DnaG [Candidatus Methanofastidiosum methylthiophilus]KYC57229.1 MAG: DNA primase DnaG [Candidatus Methanofastidiosum methylthiophilus]